MARHQQAMRCVNSAYFSKRSMTKRQEIFPFENKPAYGIYDYYKEESNQEALQLVLEPKTWNHWHCAYLQGEEHAGKTHLMHIFKEKYKAINVKESKSEDAIGKHQYFYWEDIEKNTHKEHIRLFHAYNTIIGEKKQLIITSNESIKTVAISLPDLHSRLTKAWIVKIKQPSVELIRILIQKYFSDRQTRISPSICNFISHRIPRSYKDIASIVQILDTEAIKQKKPLTKATITTILEQRDTTADQALP